MKKPKFKTPKAPERLKRLHERWELRSVKHIRLHFVRTVVVPAIAVYACGLSGVIWITEDLPMWAWLPTYFILCWWCWSGFRAFVEKRTHPFRCLDAEQVDLQDKGEDLEIGPGWRRLRATFAITRGHGKLSRTHMEWIEFSVNPETTEVRPVAASDPSAEKALKEQFSVEKKAG